MKGVPSDGQVPPTSDPATNEKPKPSFPPPKLEGYDIIAPLGEGGMGTVWRAVQVSTSREVALKVLGKGVFGSEKARARFEREVELTARLQHPNIARIYDRGAHNGICYYAMELIEGVPLDRYTEENCLPQREILSLMFAVCQAVQHAHERGIIHRDLKPSNILVTSDGQPHLLDFGVAKAFVEEDSDLSISTDGGPAGTPAYMSPEQAAGHLEEVDTRTDVYALGVILFQLLTRQTPHALSGTRYEVLRRVAEEEVRRPRELTKDIDRELEALLLKALARDPKDRYPSAGALAQDIENYLAGEPLDARRPSTAYFLWKRIKKYRFQVAAASAVLAILLGTAVFAYARIAGERAKAVHEKSLAQLARNEARTEANMAKATYESLQTMLRRIDPPTAWRGELLFSESADESVETRGWTGLNELTLTQLRDQPESEATIRMTVGRLYVAVGDFDAAEIQFSRAGEIRRQVLGCDHPETLKSMVNLAVALSKKGALGLAEGLLRRAIQVQRRVLGEEHPDTLLGVQNLGIVLQKSEKSDKAEKVLRDCVDIERRAIGEQHPNTLNSMVNLSSVLAANGKFEEAEKMLVEGWRNRVRSARTTTDADDGHRILASLATVLRAKGDLSRAEFLLKTSGEWFQFVLGHEHRDTVRAKMNLGLTLVENGKPDKAKEILRECVEVPRPHISELGIGHGHWPYGTTVFDKQAINVKQVQARVEYFRRAFGTENPETLRAMMGLGLAQLGTGKPDEAEETWRECLETQEVVLGEGNPDTLCSMMNLAVILEKKGELPQAEQMLEHILETCQPLLAEGRCDVLDMMMFTANVLRGKHLFDEAEARQRHILTICRTLLGEQHAKTIEVTGDLAMTLSGKGRHDDAEQVLRRALEARRRLVGEEDQDSLSLLAKLGIVLQERGRLEEAAQTFRRYLDIQLNVLAESKPDEVFSFSRRGYSLHGFRELGLVLERMPNVIGEKKGNREVLEFWRRLLGEGHERTIRLMIDVGEKLQNKGELDEAEGLLRRSLELACHAFGKEHDVSIRAIGSLAHLLKERGKLDEAEARSRELVAILERSHVRGDSNMLWAMKNLAEVLEKKGELGEAEAMMRKRVEFAREAPVYDSELFRTMEDLASFLQRREKPGEAEPMLRECLRLRERVYGQENAETLGAMNALASVLWETGKLEEVEALNRRSLEIRQRTQGKEHPDTLRAMSNLALVLREEGNLEEADALERECREIQGQAREKKAEQTEAMSATATVARPVAASEVLPPELVAEGEDTGGVAAPAEDDGTLLVRDDFDGRLTLDWKILEPDPTHISLTKNSGALTVTAKNGGNVFLLSPPIRATKDFEITTCISFFDPASCYQQAGLLFYDGYNRHLKFVYECVVPGVRGVTVGVAHKAELVPLYAHFAVPQELSRIWLRISKRGDQYVFSKSLDGEAFIPAGSPARWGDGSPEYIGLWALTGSAEAPEIDASFDFFEVRSVPDRTGEPEEEKPIQREDANAEDGR